MDPVVPDTSEAMPDTEFHAAVAAIHAGDVAALERLLDEHPRLLRDRLDEPFQYGGYFQQPRLLWFVADNPNLVEALPPNIVEVTRAILARGAEPEDLDYTLELPSCSPRTPRWPSRWP
jgi:hypothetical protein